MFSGRGIADGPSDSPNELFIVEHISGDKGHETVRVIALGRSKIYENVASIHANGGAGNDQVLIREGVLSDVYLDGGDGDDSLVTLGTGAATINGNAGNDYVEIGPGVKGAINVDGGDGNDNIYNNSSTASTLHGGTGDDYIQGGSGQDSIYGDAGRDEINGRGGADDIHGGDDNDLIRVTLPTSAGVTINGDAGGNDVVLVTGTPAGDTLGITASGASTIVSLAGTPSFTITGGVETISLYSGAGADSITVGSLVGTGVQRVNLETPARSSPTPTASRRRRARPTWRRRSASPTTAPRTP